MTIRQSRSMRTLCLKSFLTPSWASLKLDAIWYFCLVHLPSVELWYCCGQYDCGFAVRLRSWWPISWHCFGHFYSGTVMLLASLTSDGDLALHSGHTCREHWAYFTQLLMLTFHPNIDFPNEWLYILLIVVTLRNHNIPLLESGYNCGIAFTFYSFIHVKKWHNFWNIRIPLVQQSSVFVCVSITTE